MNGDGCLHGRQCKRGVALSNNMLVLPTNLHCAACAGDSNENQQVATRRKSTLIAEDLYW